MRQTIHCSLVFHMKKEFVEIEFKFNCKEWSDIMPGFTTHYLFGMDASRHLASTDMQKMLRREHHAFALGLQGPDVFFYDLPSYALRLQNLGALAHSKDTGKFFSNLLQSRKLFQGKKHSLAIADAYICGFIGHYTLDCTIHPYVYAFTGYSADNPPTNLEYFGQHAYFETEIDKALLYRKKHLKPSRFHQNATIRLSNRQHHVITKMLTYAYRKTYPDVRFSKFLLGKAPFAMRVGTYLLNDPSGQKKVLVRFIEKIFFGRAFLSPMFASDNYRFIKDPLNLSHKLWGHPWTKERSAKSFPELYIQAGKRYLRRLNDYAHLQHTGFSQKETEQFLSDYGNRSFLSGQPLLQSQ